MSKNPNVENAASVADRLMDGAFSATSIAESLDAAGLLVTPLHQRALEACKAYAHEYDTSRHAGVVTARRTDVIVLGREALALEKPKAEEEPEPVIERIKRMWRSVRERNKIPGPLTDALDELIKQPGCAEKPKERWVALCCDGIWRVVDNTNSDRLYKCGDQRPGWFTEVQAKAVAKALNECDR